MQGYPDKLNREISNFLKHADRDPHGKLFEFSEVVPELILHSCSRIYAEITGKKSKEMGVATVVLDLKFGFYLDLEEKRDREQEEERERERRFEGLEDDEEAYAEAKADAEQEARFRQSALLQLGRSLLIGESMFPDQSS